MKRALCKFICRMEGANLSHGRGTYTEIYKLHPWLDSCRYVVTFSIREKQGAFLTVAPADARKRTGPAGGEENHLFVVRIA
jgi:hypothetical protein